MTADDLRSIAGICGFLLLLWELFHRRVSGATLSAIATFCVLFISSVAGAFVAIVMATPVVFEERWNRRAKKDMLRAALAAGVIATSVALLLVYS